MGQLDRWNARDKKGQDLQQYDFPITKFPEIDKGFPNSCPMLSCHCILPCSLLYPYCPFHSLLVRFIPCCSVLSYHFIPCHVCPVLTCPLTFRVVLFCQTWSNPVPCCPYSILPVLSTFTTFSTSPHIYHIIIGYICPLDICMASSNQMLIGTVCSSLTCLPPPPHNSIFHGVFIPLVISFFLHFGVFSTSFLSLSPSSILLPSLSSLYLLGFWKFSLPASTSLFLTHLSLSPSLPPSNLLSSSFPPSLFFSHLSFSVPLIIVSSSFQLPPSLPSLTFAFSSRYPTQNVTPSSMFPYSQPLPSLILFSLLFLTFLYNTLPEQ